MLRRGWVGRAFEFEVTIGRSAGVIPKAVAHISGDWSPASFSFVFGFFCGVKALRFMVAVCAALAFVLAPDLCSVRDVCVCWSPNPNLLLSAMNAPHAKLKLTTQRTKRLR
jgi:hypothetical protein